MIDGSGSSDPEGGAIQFAWACAAGLPIQPVANGSALQVDARASTPPPAACASRAPSPSPIRWARRPSSSSP
ncbi:MAG: hypothetical protein R3F60_27895 [bacterium]